MDDPAKPAIRFAATDYLALERTYLAWIRTGLALMGFGFVVARFGLFLETLQAADPSKNYHTLGLSLWFGTALIVIGVGSLIFSSVRYVSLIRDFNRGVDTYRLPVTPAVGLAALLALVGLAMAVYLLSV